MIRRIVAILRAYRKDRQTRLMLYSLSDRTLSDIGLRRDQIEDYSFFRR